MDRTEDEMRRDLLLLGATLLGVALGHVLRARARPQPASQEAEATAAMSVPALVAAAGLSGRIGDAVGLDGDDLPVRIGLAVATGAALTYFADSLAQMAPGLLPARR